jgi:hypothetical protein
MLWDIYSLISIHTIYILRFFYIIIIIILSVSHKQAAYIDEDFFTFIASLAVVMADLIG